MRWINGGCAAVLGSLSVLHLAWTAGSTWPATNSHDLALAVAGIDRMPGRGWCLAVGVGLGAAAVMVSDAAGSSSLVRLGRVAIGTGFLVRGVAGVGGHTGQLVGWVPEARFVQWDRRCYGPLCLAIGAAAVSSGVAA